jgi:tetratricopeptide (TPR) repeat protein
MESAAPQSKASEAFNRLVDLAEEAIVPDELALARFEKAARDSMHNDPGMAFQVLGVVAMLRWRLADVKSNFEEAIRQGAGVDGMANYGRALADMNEARAAAAQLFEAARREPGRLEFLRGAISYAYCAGEWTRALNLVESLERRTPDLDEGSKRIKDVIGFAQKIGVRDETVMNSVDCALAFLRDKKIRTLEFGHSTERLRGEECIYLAINIGGDDDAAAALDDELTPVLFESVQDLQLGSFVLSIQTRPFYDAAR